MKTPANIPFNSYSNKNMLDYLKHIDYRNWNTEATDEKDKYRKIIDKNERQDLIDLSNALLKTAEGTGADERLIEYLKFIDCTNWDISESSDSKTRRLMTDTEREMLVHLHTSLLIPTGDQNIDGIKIFLDTIKAHEGLEISGNLYPDTLGYNIGSIGTPKDAFINMFLKNSTIWLDDNYKLSIEDNNLRYRKRNVNVVPRSIYNKYKTQNPFNNTNYTVTIDGQNKYNLNGSISPTLTLIRGNTYTFDVSGTSNLNKYLKLSEHIGGDDSGSYPTSYDNGVTITGTPGEENSSNCSIYSR